MPATSTRKNIHPELFGAVEIQKNEYTERTKATKNKIKLLLGDAMDHYDSLESPTVIISDGPYGVSGFPGDPPTHNGLANWYRPHIKKWTERSTPQTTLWFWNTEVGWATVHPVLVEHGWRYRACYVWDKGMGHVAGNVNGKSMRKLPVVTEICVQYVKDPVFTVVGENMSMKDWLRHEWARTGLPFRLTNEACGVKDAATRKYFTKCHLWYFPPAEAFEKIANYANKYGKKDGLPFFSINGIKPLTRLEWEKMRAKFNFVHGYTNVWQEPTVMGKERLKSGSKAIHLNQKPLSLMRLIVQTTSDVGDFIWEPFGGLCSGVLAAAELDRRGAAIELNEIVFNQARERIARHAF